MWDTDVLELRMVAVYDGPLPASLEQLRMVVSDRYGVVFDSCLVNLYRDGSDAVAWHGDTVRKVLRDPLVVTISLARGGGSSSVGGAAARPCCRGHAARATWW